MKKIICPDCKKEIEGLKYYSKVEVTQDCYLDGSLMSYEAMDDYGDHTDETYACPECDKVLATNEEDAIKILRGKKITDINFRTIKAVLKPAEVLEISKGKTITWADVDCDIDISMEKKK